MANLSFLLLLTEVYMCDIWSSSSHFATIKERHTLFPEPYPAKSYCEFFSYVIKTNLSLFKLLLLTFLLFAVGNIPN